MELFSIPIILRAVEILLNVITIGVFYGTDTRFSNVNSSDNFGQFVLIGGLVSACIMIAVTMFLDINKKMPLVAIAYNAVWILFYFVASCIILSYWSGSDLRDQQKKHGGQTVGSFFLFEVAILIANSIFTFFGRTQE